MSKPTFDDLTLVADIGGTNTRVALAHGAKLQSESIERFSNREHTDLESVLASYMSRHGRPGAGACLAVAGLVRNGRAEMTNLDWSIDHDLLARITGARRVAIINDLQAQGHAIGNLPKTSLKAVANEPVGASDFDPGTKLVIGLGTGFNAVTVHETPHGRLVPASETGHADLPVRTALDLELAQFLRRTYGFASIERALSGPGLENIHLFMGRNEDITRASAAEILKRLENGDATARATLAQFSHLLGAVVGTLALIHLPVGGVFLVGGVARATAAHLAPLGFTRSLCAMGEFSEFVQSIPVRVVHDDWAALIGAASYMAQLSEFTRS